MGAAVELPWLVSNSGIVDCVVVASVGDKNDGAFDICGEYVVIVSEGMAEEVC